MCFVLKLYTDISAETLIFGVREVCANACHWDLDVTGPWMNMWGSCLFRILSPKLISIPSPAQSQIILYTILGLQIWGIRSSSIFQEIAKIESGEWTLAFRDPEVVVWENQRRNTEKDCLGSEVSYGFVEFLRAPEGLESLVAHADC